MAPLEINEGEPVATFIQKVGTRTGYGKVEVNLAATGHLLHDRVVVHQMALNLFAARLYHESPDLYRDFLEAFPGADAGQFVGEP